MPLPSLTLLHSTALTHVPAFGWSEAALKEAAVELGLADYRLVFAGVAEWIQFYFDALDAELETQAKNIALSSLKIRQRIFELVKLRFSLLPENKEITRRLLAALMQPSLVGLGMKRLWKTADSIWWLAGDTSTDWNHYSKRTLLSGIYSSTLLVWLNDESADHAKSWEFLQRRIDNVMQIEKVKAECKKRFHV